MIPKKIHYIWVGGKEKPKDIKRCLKTWKKLEGYEIIEWNEQNFDISSHPFVKAAYDAKKWAYVSDYIRMYVLYNHGGIYLDTDVIVLDNFDDFLNTRAFVGFESDEYLSAAVLATEKKHPLIKKFLDHYDNLTNYSFNFEDNNSIIMTNILEENFGLQKNNKEQLLKENIKIYKNDVLSRPSKNSKVIHIYTGTWLSNKKSLKSKIVLFLKSHIKSKKGAILYEKIIGRK